MVGVTGAPGAGKTTLVERLLAVIAASPPPGIPDLPWVAHVPMDGFHLADVELDRLGLRDRKGAPDTFDAAGYAALLRRLREAPTGVFAPGFERTLEQPIAAAIAVEPSARLVLTEGNYLLLDRIRGLGAPRARRGVVRRRAGRPTGAAADRAARRVRQVRRRGGRLGEPLGRGQRAAGGADPRPSRRGRAAAGVTSSGPPARRGGELSDDQGTAPGAKGASRTAMAGLGVGVASPAGRAAAMGRRVLRCRTR